ncbi:aminoacyl-histidine dipeptidase [Mariniblastus sp.]|nr:aminoacyl-histidine dipeptidase [Mariniblastus sp.]
MNDQVANLEPSIVWTHFEQLNAVPRPSKQEERVIQFMKNFGESLGFETIVDSVGNVIIKKPATAGLEDRQTVILQSHLDMVHQKNSDTQFDFQTQGIQSYIDGEWVKAKGTTLGADNGMGAASMMAVLSSSDIQHGPLECLFTIDEETGMTGAQNIDQGLLTGKILINTDTEDEGELCIGCAGGIDSTVTMSYPTFPVSAIEFEYVSLRVSVTGLKGGHSGCEIHLGRGNANKIMNDLLQTTAGTFGVTIGSIAGGSLRNAIPRESFATVVVPQETVDGFRESIECLTNQIQKTLNESEPELSVTIEPTADPETVMDPTSQQVLLNSLDVAPNGVHSMSQAVPNLVETSTNLSKVNVADGTVTIDFLTRSSVETSRDELAAKIRSTFPEKHFQVQEGGAYPGWEPNAESDIKRLMISVYQELYGNEPIVNAVHAGLECGILGSRYPGMDMISFGPTIKHPHSPDEKCHIPSVKKYWDFLLAVLEKIPAS